MSVTVVVAVIGFAATVGTAGPTQAIAYGNPVTTQAEFAEVDYSVRLDMYNIPEPDGSTYNSHCSGALVSDRWILTAGHCFHDVNRVRVSGKAPYRTIATIGRYQYSDTSQGEQIRIKWVYQSPDNDMSLARLQRPAKTGNPVAMNTDGQITPAVGDEKLLAGWGLTTNPGGGLELPDYLQTGRFLTTGLDEYYTYEQGIWPNDDGTSPCPYDSGSPYTMMHDGRPVITSVEVGGPSCPHNQSDTTSRVDAVADWIKETMSNPAKNNTAPNNVPGTAPSGPQGPMAPKQPGPVPLGVPAAPAVSLPAQRQLWATPE